MWELREVLGQQRYFLFLQVGEGFRDDHGVFDTGDDFHGATLCMASFNVDVEHPLEALRPRH